MGGILRAVVSCLALIDEENAGRWLSGNNFNEVQLIFSPSLSSRAKKPFLIQFARSLDKIKLLPSIRAAKFARARMQKKFIRSRRES